jgi:hypothetical protein
VSSLRRYLLARIEDERRLARAALNVRGGDGVWWFQVGVTNSGDDEYDSVDVWGASREWVAETSDGTSDPVYAQHIVAQDPRSTLRRLNVLESVLDLHAPVGVGTPPDLTDVCRSCREGSYPCHTVRLLAAPYQDRDDYPTDE